MQAKLLELSVMGRHRRRIEPEMLAPECLPSSQLQHTNENDPIRPEKAPLRPATPAEKFWMVTLAALMAAVMMAWLSFLIWGAWRLLRPLAP